LKNGIIAFLRICDALKNSFLNPPKLGKVEDRKPAEFRNLASPPPSQKEILEVISAEIMRASMICK
jgi:hypothetical protein